VTNPDDRRDNVSPSDSATIAAAKRDARDRAGAARNRLRPAARKRASTEAALNLLALTELAAARCLLAYFALPAEIDPLPASTALRRTGLTIAYPRIESPGVLGVHAVDDEQDLVSGSFGLSQPREDAAVVELARVDAVIVPGLAFDDRGRRIGYGGGYYDRLLPRLRPDCLRIGLAFDEQILAEIPAEPHDATVDLIVTQTRVIRPSNQRTA
jgi:5-formyltetrahydrofolate cyclo-ligase